MPCSAGPSRQSGYQRFLRPRSRISLAPLEEGPQPAGTLEASPAPLSAVPVSDFLAESSPPPVCVDPPPILHAARTALIRPAHAIGRVRQVMRPWAYCSEAGLVLGRARFDPSQPEEEGCDGHSCHSSFEVSYPVEQEERRIWEAKRSTRRGSVGSTRRGSVGRASTHEEGGGRDAARV